jgi:O-antigen ligase
VRLSAYKILPELMRENNILFGSGIGDVRDIVQKKYIQTFGPGKMFDYVKGHIHNTFLSILISLGVIGLSIFVYFLYSILKLRLLDNKLELIKYSFIFTIVFSSFSDNLLGQISVLMLFALFFSVLVISLDRMLT